MHYGCKIKKGDKMICMKNFTKTLVYIFLYDIIKSIKEVKL